MGGFKRVEQGAGCCPVCGSKLEHCLLIADLNTNTLSYQGLKWNASPKIIEFLHTVIAAFPLPVSDIDLWQALYGYDWENKSYGLLGQYAWRINMMLMPVGLRLYRVLNKSYRLGPVGGGKTGISEKFDKNACTLEP